jgi:hypothetical protein
MRTRKKLKARNKTQKQKKTQTLNKKKYKRNVGGGIFDYPTYYMQKAVSMFSVNPPVAYGNTSNVKPFPYFQSK